MTHVCMYVQSEPVESSAQPRCVPQRQLLFGSWGTFLAGWYHVGSQAGGSVWGVLSLVSSEVCSSRTVALLP